jgi:predicted DNA-binding transcriptional regulator AlpA
MLDHDLDGHPRRPASVLGAREDTSRTAALSRAADLDRLPAFALLPERDLRTLLGGCSSMTIERLVTDGRLPKPMRLRGESGRGSSPRLWTVADVRTLVDRMAVAQRGVS